MSRERGETCPHSTIPLSLHCGHRSDRGCCDDELARDDRQPIAQPRHRDGYIRGRDRPRLSHRRHVSGSDACGQVGGVTRALPYGASHASSREKPAVKRAFVATGLVTPAEVTLADFEAVRPADLGERVRSLACPVLWLDGADDQIVGPPAERPGEARRLEGVGHLVPIEAPGAVAEGVVKVLSRLTQ
jgi:pimeloyl-ACP methyl ester carboxylesterase